MSQNALSLPRDQDAWMRQAELLMQTVGASRRGSFELLFGLLHHHGAVTSRDLVALVSAATTPPDVRSVACWMLPPMVIREHRALAVRVARALIAHGHAPLRCAAASVLVRLRASGAYSASLALLGDPSIEARLGGLHGLGVLADRRAAPHLVKRVLDAAESEEVRACAARSLARLRAAGIEPALSTALAQPDPRARLFAAMAIGTLSAQGATTTLRALAEGDHALVPGYGRVSDAAREALARATTAEARAVIPRAQRPRRRGSPGRSRS